MKQTSIIRISFFICAALAVIAFWSGFYFGENSVVPQEDIQIASESSFPDKDSTQKETASSAVPSENSLSAPETVESMQGLSAEKYYLKLAGEYLAVYYSDTDELYFETDLKLSDLPEEMQPEAEDGISFSSMEEVYGFLENYSS